MQLKYYLENGKRYMPHEGLLNITGSSDTPWLPRLCLRETVLNAVRTGSIQMSGFFIKNVNVCLTPPLKRTELTPEIKLHSSRKLKVTYATLTAMACISWAWQAQKKKNQLRKFNSQTIIHEKLHTVGKLVNRKCVCVQLRGQKEVQGMQFNTKR